MFAVVALDAESSAYAIPADVYAPRTEEQRYRLYVRAGDDLRLLTTSDAGGLGVAIVSQDEDVREAGGKALYDIGQVGILDAVERRWLVLPWPRGGP